MKNTIYDTKGFCGPKLPFAPLVTAQGKLVFVSGQGPIEPTEKEIVPTRGSLAEQFHLTMKNISLHLEAVGCGMQDVVMVRVFLSDNSKANWQKMTEEFEKWFPDRSRRPARTTIGCQLVDIDVEIDCVAVIPE